MTPEQFKMLRSLVLSRLRAAEENWPRDADAWRTILDDVDDAFGQQSEGKRYEPVTSSETQWHPVRTVRGPSPAQMLAAKDAKVFQYDRKNRLLVAWYGGHGIHAYDHIGKEVAFWNVGTFAKDNADHFAVIASIKAVIEGREEYPWA